MRDPLATGWIIPRCAPHTPQHDAPPTPGLEHARILYGWREIGQYLRRSKPTVLAWHAKRPMPVSKIGCSVVVPRSALDVWILNAPHTTTYRSGGGARAHPAPGR